MSQTSWRDDIEQTQLLLQQDPSHCFVCGREIPADCPDCLIQAYLDLDRQQRIAVVCGRAACLAVLADQKQDTWGALFRALMHWPDRAIAPLGPYWRVPRHHRFTFRTDPRRTLYTN